MTTVAHFLHARLLWLLVAAYVLAGVAPAAGLALRAGYVGGASFPSLLLGLLLFNAGLGVEPGRLRGLAGRAGVLATGLLANVAVPLLFIVGVASSLALWPEVAEVQSILVGLALIAAMPIAGSSTAWAQNADGDLALSLGLVLGSTLLSPLTTPAVLHAVGWLASGESAHGLHELAAGGTSSFLAVFVLLPSLGGIVTRVALGGKCIQPLKPGLKVLNTAALLLLCYSNAAVALPRTFAAPDWDFLLLNLVVVAGLCGTGFAAGGAIAARFGADPARRASLAFGLGMTNNGTGLVVASTALAATDALLPLIFYNLVQHAVAALFQRLTATPEAAR